MKFYHRPEINPLTVRCPWCRAGIGQRCQIPGLRTLLKLGSHPSRVEAAASA